MYNGCMSAPVPSARAEAIQHSATIAVSTRARELRAAGKDVIGLGAGEPDFDTPDFIKQAAADALAAGDTKYTAADGTPQLKEAVAQKFARENGLHYEAAQIIVSSGAKHSVFNLLMALVDAGDEVVIPAPYWVSYPDMVKLCGATPVIVHAGMTQGLKITAQQLSDALTPATRLFILNSPNNPTGAVYSRAELSALGEVLAGHPRVLVASDDIYEHILWSGEPFCNIAMACPELAGRTVVINGVSKAYAMTGWRIGYAAGPAGIIGAMKKIQSQSTSNPASVSQAAAVAALSSAQSPAAVARMAAAFRERHDFVVAALNEVPGFHCLPSGGTFYAFPDAGEAVRNTGAGDDIALAALLLEQAEVALVPGSAFGAPDHLRLSYAAGLDVLRAAVARIKKVLS